MEETYHFIGIGGIGMSALARILLGKGAEVSGSDANTSLLTALLEKEGATIYSGHSGASHSSTVIYSTSIKKDNPEIVQARKEKATLLHRSELLHSLMQEQKSLLIAGTHGKTTTSALLTSVLHGAHFEPSYAVGGIVKNLGFNGGYGRGEYFVAEADESDGSFLRYQAHAAIITSLGIDHLDHWNSAEAMKEGFMQFANQVTTDLFWCIDDAKYSLQGMSYGFSPTADIRITNYQQKGWQISYDLTIGDRVYSDIVVNMIGKHNARNSAAVFALALKLGVKEKLIRESFRRFQGIARRVDHKGTIYEIAIYDDYGHHPTEIKATLKAMKRAIEGRRLILAFQPHRYSRTRDFFDEFCFSDADEVIITDIYSAGEELIENISAETLAKRTNATYVAKEDIINHLDAMVKPYDVIVTMGAGDITHIGNQLYKKLEEGLPKTLHVAVLFGGRSCESKVSLMSAQTMLNALHPTLHKVSPVGMGKPNQWVTGENALLRTRDLLDGKKVDTAPFPQELLEADICIPVCHGPFGEDGMIQGFLETIGVPYVGNDYAASALSMDKVWTKEVALQNGIDTASFITFSNDEWENDREECLSKIKLSIPLYVKPIHQGSNIGVIPVETEEDLIPAIEKAFLFDYRILIEEKIFGKEIEFALLGNDDVEVAVPIEIKHSGMQDYDAKYGANPNPSNIPPDLPDELIEKGKEVAKKTYKALGCSGLARIDFILNEDNNYYLIESNPFPGMTPNSPYPKLWEKSGLSNEKLIERLLILGMERKRLLDRKFQYLDPAYFVY